ncbi:MAG TPA: hypothetical protein VLA88_00655 [Candidatus Saccharimonadales bacterium]|nr:hypothetical protein [Candidatus Saccharimonadales bacterium]
MAMRHRLSLIGDLATKRVIKQFAAKYHLVYFGAVDAREDEHELVRGVTVSTSHIDNHYTVGTLQGRDITVVHRKNTLTFPGKAPSQYKWLILQLDLARTGLPHIFIDAHHHDETFYANLFIALPQFQNVTAHLFAQDAAFSKHCKAFGFPHDYEAIAAVLQPDVTAAIGHHFHQFDYEIIDDRLYVYASNSVVTMTVLQEMLRVGVWLADFLDGKSNSS